MDNCKLCGGQLRNEDWVDFKSEPYYPIEKILNGEITEIHRGDKIHARCSLLARGKTRQKGNKI